MPVAPPTSAFPVIPGVSVMSVDKLRELVGSATSSSFEITFCCRTFAVSTSGVAPVTVIVSSRDPTSMAAFTVAVNPAGSSTPSRRTVLKPVNVNVTVYAPGLRSTTL